MNQPATQYRKPPAKASGSLICWNDSSTDIARITPNDAPEQRFRCNRCGANGEESDFRGVESTAAIVNRRRRA